MKPEICDIERLDAFLNGQLGEQDESDLTRHLDHCASCVAELERRAADQSRWEDAKTHLSSSSRLIEPQNKTGQTDALPINARQIVNMLDPTDDPERMGRIGSYEIIGVVGSGAMGVVLKAADRALDRIVALKVMNPALAACGTARQRFAREARAAAGVLHPNIIAIHGVSTDQALPYLVMPYVAGTSVQQRLDRQGPLMLPEILRIGSQVAAGLAAAHQQGLIHRDIKPSNIMLDSGVENAVITDFGLARTIDDATMTRTGAITGTPEFMSPEQARGDSIEFSSDIFSLGSVLYALCTGQTPFRAQTSFGVLRKITDETPTPIRELNPDIPIWFCKLIEEMHSKSPEKRPTAAKLKELLEGSLAHVYQPDQIPLPDGLIHPVRSRTGFLSSPFQIGVFSVMTISIIAVLFAAFLPDNTMPESPDKLTTSTEMIAPSDTPTVFKTHHLQFPKPGQKGRLVVDINRGFIEVTGHDRSEVIIEILNPLKKGTDEKVNALFAPRYDLDTDAKDNSIKLDTYNQNYALNMRIKVPLETDLSLDTYYDGYLKVENVAGTINTRSQNCDITLLDIAGTATGFGYNGNFVIRFREVSPTAQLDFESYNGSIDLTLPAGIAATTAISTGQGTYLSAFDIEPLTEDDRARAKLPVIKSNANEYQYGTINGGGVPIRIESEKGKIQLRKPEM